MPKKGGVIKRSEWEKAALQNYKKISISKFFILSKDNATLNLLMNVTRER